MPTPGISHLGVDTSALIGAGWPHPTVDLENVVATCTALNIPVLLPEIVLVEAAVIWSEHTAKSIKDAQDALERARRRIPELINPKAIGWPDKQTRDDAYQRATDAALARWKWTVAPLPRLSLAEAVELSAKHQPPFAPTDQSFRDSLLLLSLLDQLRPGDVLGLVSGDGFFAQAPARLFANSREVGLVVLKTAQEAWSAIEKIAGETALHEKFERWERMNSSLTTALEPEQERLEAFIRTSLVVPERPYGQRGTIDAVRQIRVVRINSARVAFPETSVDRSKASADVKLRIEVIRTEYETAAPRAMREGQAADDVPSVSGGGTSLVEIDAFATVDLRVEWSADGKPSKVEFTGARFETQEEREMMHGALIKAFEEHLRKG